MKTTLEHKSPAHNEKRFRAVFDALDDAVMLQSCTAGTFIEANLRALEIFGYTHAEFLNLDLGSLFDLRSPAMLDNVAALKTCRRNGKPVVLDGMHVAKDGHRFSGEVSARRIRFGEEDAILITIRDITERKRRESALGAVTLNYREFFEHALDAVTALDPRTGKYFWANPSAVKLFGAKDEEEYIRSNPLTYSPERQPDGRMSVENIREHVETVMRGGSLFFEWTHKRLDGTPFFTEITLTRVGEGDDALIFAIIRDTTERKRLEVSLRHSQERLELATAAAHLGIWDLDTVADTMTWNAQMHELYGVTEADFSRNATTHGARDAWQAGLHPDDRDRAMAASRAAIADGTNLDFEFRIVRPNGEVHHTEAHAVARGAPGGPTTRMVGVTWDISERKQLEASLRQSRERLELATQSAGIGIWDFDIPANRLLWDERMFDLYGIREEDFSGAYDAWQAGLHPEDRARGDAAIGAAIDGVKDFNIEFRVVWPNGEIHDIEAHALVQGARGGPATRMVGVNWDITERKRATETIRLQAEKYGR